MPFVSALGKPRDLHSDVLSRSWIEALGVAPEQLSPSLPWECRELHQIQSVRSIDDSIKIVQSPKTNKGQGNVSGSCVMETDHGRQAHKHPMSVEAAFKGHPFDSFGQGHASHDQDHQGNAQVSRDGGGGGGLVFPLVANQIAEDMVWSKANPAYTIPCTRWVS